MRNRVRKGRFKDTLRKWNPAKEPKELSVYKC